MELSAEKREKLRLVYQSQKAESQQHRQNLFNSFTWWTTALLTIMGFSIVVQSQLNIIPKIMIVISATIISILTILFMKRQRSYSTEAVRIVRDIEEQLGLFDKDNDGKSVLPESFRTVSKDTTTSDRIQISVIVVLTVLVWVAICC